ncbi:MAG: extracellular solute-binding protein family 1, partial [Paenibacillus sp.]|nr:extracellular solute-binding protein family 1 [Paenibacillus sp.]
VITAKFPHITIKHTHRGTGKNYADLITAGEIPDIILESRTNVNTNIIGNGLDYDLADMIKAYKFDLSRIQKPVLQQMINSNQTGKIYGLPFSVNAYVTFYNKDIFDKFGVSYPVNGMTWDETYELARKLTRTDNGTAYHGFQAFEPQFMNYNALSLSPLSLTEDKATMQTPEWSRLLTDRKRFYEIPGNTYVHVDDFPKGYIAMASHVSEMVINYPQKNPTMNWDLAALPSYPDKPKTGLQANAYFLFISKTSKYKDQAFQVIDYLLSDEVQKQQSRVASLTPLVSKAVQQSFGESIPHLKGKHLDALFYNEYAMPPAPRADRLIYYNANAHFGDFTEMISKNLDVNTTLRQIDEKINKGIQEEKAKSGAK